MRKKHTYEDRLKYMKLLEDGYSINYIATRYGISHHLGNYYYWLARGLHHTEVVRLKIIHVHRQNSTDLVAGGIDFNA